jgi:hypothetical protein
MIATKGRYQTKFKIKSQATDFFFYVVIYDDIDSMRKDIVWFDRLTGKKEPDPEKDVLGVCQPFIKIRVLANGEEANLKNIGIIRLCKDFIGTEIISHEILHAAIWQYRIEYGTERPDGSIENADFGNNCSQDEENFCHLYGQLFSNFVKKMYRLEIY